MDILMISYWDFQEHGMQVTKRTPLYFAQQGHKVTFMVHSETTEKPSLIKDLHPNVKILRFDLPLKPLLRIPKLRRIRQLFFFGVLCIFNALKMYRDGKKPNVIYAAECDAIFIGVFLRWFFNIPLITRYYGVSNVLLKHQYKHTLYALSLRCPANMAIITDDGTEGKKIIKRMNEKIGTIHFWKNGIDKPIIDSKKIRRFYNEFRIQDNQVVLITVGRLYGWKRIDRAIKVLAYLVYGKKLRVKLLVVGHGPERPHLERLAQDLGVDDALEFTGPVQHENIYNVYALADIFMSFHDMANLGNPLWEAINSGLCIVTLKTGDTAQVISNGINGMLFQIDSDEEGLIKRLADAIEELVCNPEYRKKLATGAKEYGKKHLWTWDERLRAELDNILRLIDS
jgi:glycosyltransferase involved in cell wall biosynthesis